MISFMDKLRNLFTEIDEKPVVGAKEEFEKTKKELVHILEEHGLDQAFKEMEERLKDVSKK